MLEHHTGALLSASMSGMVITSTQVATDQGALRIWRWVSLPEGGQKCWLLWQLADTAWLAGARVAATRSAYTISFSSAKPPASKFDFRE